MMNKKAQITGLYMVFVTIFMICLVFGLYHVQQKNVQGMVISPMKVLHERDRLEIFENREEVLIKESLEKASGSFGSDEFLDSFRNNFFMGIDENMKDFLSGDLYKGDVEINSYDDLIIENAIYPRGNTFYRDGQLIFTRDSLNRLFIMRGNSEKIVFPTEFVFEFDRKYFIKKIDDDFEVRFS